MLAFLLEQTASNSSAAWMNIVMIALIFLIFFFFFIRQQSKRYKEFKKFQDSLVKGKKVVTSGGIFGTICEIKENIAIIEIADGVKIKVNKSMLYDVVENTTKSENDKK